MPKISASTVAEHRHAQHSALLAAAEQILLEDGVDAVTPGKVTSAAGLGRSTFYEYFPSRDDILVALARVAFEQWNAELQSATDAAPAGADRLRVYVEKTLAMTADGRHHLATALRDVDLSPKGREDIAALHDALAKPIMELMASLPFPTSPLSPMFVRGALGSGMTLVNHGVPAAQVASQLTPFILGGLEK